MNSHGGDRQPRQAVVTPDPPAPGTLLPCPLSGSLMLGERGEKGTLTEGLMCAK